MKSLLDWVRWGGSYLILGSLYYTASKGDPVALYVFPSLCVIRAIALIFIAFIMDSSWYEARSKLFNFFRFVAEISIALAIFHVSHTGLAIVSLLAFGVYELGRIRISPIEIL